MKIKFSQTIKKPGFIPIVVIFALTAANMLVWLAHYILVRTDGFYTNITGHPAIPFAVFVIAAVFLLGTADADKLSLFSIMVSVPAVLVLSALLVGTGREVYSHFENSVLLADERFEIEQISLDELESISDGSFAVYVGRPDCGYCRTAYDTLYKFSAHSPLQLHYYNTSDGRKTERDRMMEVLEKYEVTTVPAVVFFVDGKADKTIFYEEIASDFPGYIEEYARRNVYFNKKLKV